MRLVWRRRRLFDETNLTKERIKSLKLVILAVAFGTVCFNITGGVAMTGYLKLMGVSDFAYGLIMAIGPATALLQILASFVLERTRKRKSLFMVAGILNRTAWLPFGLVPLLFPMAGPTLHIWTAILFLLISSVNNPFVNVTFYSFVADLVPMPIRGRYFSVRQRVSLLFGIAGGLLTAFLLDRFTGFTGYALVFTLASVFGTLDILTFIFVEFPPMAEPDPNAKTNSIKTMLTEVFTNKRFMRVIIFATLWNFAIQITAPFALVYAKTMLAFSNTAITVTTQIIPSLCMVLVLPMWGRSLDRYGNKPIMVISASVASFTPMLWFFAFPGGHALWVIALSSVAQGLVISGLDLGLQNVYLGQSPLKNRSIYVAVFFCTTSILGIGLANMSGGWLLDHVLLWLERADTPLNRYNYLFLLGSLLRAVAAFVLLPHMVREENATPVKTILRGIRFKRRG